MTKSGYINGVHLNNIYLLGRIPRNEVLKLMEESDVFVMISKDETFGLVYLEAMSKGCIVIASKNEGMDGIIEHGVNGYLCQAGNEEELVEVLREIRNLSAPKRKSIAANAIETVKKMTDKIVAEDYLNCVLGKNESEI